MKKIFTILCFALMAVAANAQKLQVMKDGKVMAEFYGKDGWEFVFDSDETPGTGNIIGGHEYVEIGGVKWATMNIGATTVAGSYKTCYGDYFALGEASPRYYFIFRESATEAEVSSWKNEYPEGYRDTGKKGEEDAATVNWGSNWRTPTKEEFDALFRACGAVLYKFELPEPTEKITKGGMYYLREYQTVEPEYSGVEGVLFVDVSNPEKRLFFPNCGYLIGDEKNQRLGVSSYWTTTKANGDQYYAPKIWAKPEAEYTMPYYWGCPIRPVVK